MRMLRTFRKSIALMEPLYTASRSLAFTSLAFKWNYAAYTRNSDLGRHVYQAFAVNVLINKYPNWSASEIDDVAQGVADSDVIHSKVSQLPVLTSAEDSTDVFAKLGKLRLKEEEHAIDELLNEININCLSSISSVDMGLFIKSQHPKVLLKQISEDENVRVFLSTRKLSYDSYEATVYLDDHEICKEKNESKKEAERKTCFRALKEKFAEQFDSIDIGSIDLPLEEDINLGSIANKYRVVSLTKSTEDSYGFTIRGGEQKIIRNKEYIQLHITTPVFISHIEEGSPAEKHGLKVGDVLLAVNDHSFKETTHRQAVSAIKKFSKREEVEFTVIYNKDELRKYEAEQNYLDREKEKIRNEINSKRFGKWHQAKAKLDPEEYYLEKFEHKKRPYQKKKARASVRLWDKY